MLVDLEPVNQGVPGGPECGISRGYRAGDNTDHGDNGAQVAHQAGADVIHNAASAMVFHESFAQAGSVAIEGNTGSRPDQSNDRTRCGPLSHS